MDGIIPSARLHRVLSKDVSYQVEALELPLGGFTSSDGEAAQHLLMTHFPGGQPIEEYHSAGRVLQEPAHEDWDLASGVVSKDNVRRAIDGFGTFKAAGEDGLLQHGIEIIIGHYKHFCCMFGVWLHTACIQGSEGYMYT
jgi:hypothetical protein